MAIPAAGKRRQTPLKFRHFILSVMAIAMIFYLAFLLSAISTSTPASKATLAHESRSMPSQAGASTMVGEVDIEMAEFAYNEQKGERNERAQVSELFAKYGANWPCFWGETAVGDLNTWKTRWETLKDGWKYVCGLSHITEPCVVYSLGSNGNMAFEKELLKKAPHCEVHTFDKSILGDINQWFTDEELKNNKVHIHPMFISSKDDLAKTPPHRSVPSIMAELGHTHIDILKMDIEGAEWEILTSGSDLQLKMIGQLQLEVHLDLGENINLPGLFEYLESGGMRLFHKEVNWRYAVTTCMEYAFIQKNWSPDRKTYSS